MRLTRIYQKSTISVGQDYQLDGRGHNHIFNVLRLKADDSLILFNGTGIEFNCVITSANKKYSIVKVIDSYTSQKESSLKTHLGQVISKSDRMDFAIQKAVELGISEITPLKSDFSGLKLSEVRLEKKMRHWEKVIISACEQCHRNIIPKLYPPTHLKTWLIETNADLKLIFDTGKETHGLSYDIPESVAFAIGPEGGFSENELQVATKNKFNKTSLGPRVLRTETATTTAISIIQYLWGDFR